jgi:chromosome segregation ATPase
MSKKESLEAEARHEAAMEEAQKLVAEVNGLRERLENQEAPVAERDPQASIPSHSTPTETFEAEIRSFTAQHDDPLQTQTAADEQRSKAELREEAALEEIARLMLENDALRDCLEEMHSDAIKRETAETTKKPSATRVKGPVQARLEKENNALKASKSELTGDIARVCAENNDLAETVHLLQTREKLLQDRLDDLERQRANEERDRTKVTTELGGAYKQLDDVYKRSDQLEGDLQQTAEDLQQSRVKESRARTELATARANVTKLQSALNRFKATVEQQGNDLFELKHSPTSPTFSSADPSSSSASSSFRTLVRPESKGFTGLMTPNDTPTVPPSKVSPTSL